MVFHLFERIIGIKGDPKDRLSGSKGKDIAYLVPYQSFL